MSMMSVVLAVVVVLALVYFFRPQTFNFLTQGFSDSSVDPDEEGFVDCPAGEEDDGTGRCVATEGFFACVDGVDDETGESC